jgi:hypothetical protein
MGRIKEDREIGGAVGRRSVAYGSPAGQRWSLSFEVGVACRAASSVKQATPACIRILVGGPSGSCRLPPP